MRGIVCWVGRKYVGVKALENLQGVVWECLIKSHLYEKSAKNSLVAGDMVSFDPLEKDERSHQGIIHARDERSTEVCRWNVFNNSVQCICANMDGIALIVSPTDPFLDEKFVLRGFLLAEILSISFLLICNKSDLGIKEYHRNYFMELRMYGIEVVELSTHKDDVSTFLYPFLKDKKTILLGRSGVGKSSVLNALFPSADLRTQAVQDNSGRGRHTTAQSSLWMTSTFWIADSPGVNKLNLYAYSLQQITKAFFTMHSSLSPCNYRACTHIHEPGCSIKKAYEREQFPLHTYNYYQGVIKEWIATEKDNAKVY